MSDLKKTVLALNIQAFFNGAMLWYGIEQLFINSITDRPVELKAISVAIWALSYAILNIPFGAISDKLGRKTTILVGYSIRVASLAWVGLGATGYVEYLVFAALYGATYSLVSGADSALLYDSLKDNNSSDEYTKRSGTMNSTMLIGAATANIASGFIANWLGLQANYYLSALASFAAIIAVLALAKEPAHHKNADTNLVHISKKAFIQVRKSKGLLLYSGIIASYICASFVINEFAQIAYISVDSDPRRLGLYWFLVAVAMALGSSMSSITRRNIIRVSSVMIAMSIAAIYGEWVTVIACLIMAGIVESLLVTVEAVAQDTIESGQRATTISIIKSAGYLLLGLLMILLGLLGEATEVRIIIGSACGLLSLFAFCSLAFRNARNENASIR